MNLTLTTERLTLRVLTASDAGLVADFYTRNLTDLSETEPNLSERYLSDDFNEAVLKYEFQSTCKGNSVRYWISPKDDLSVLYGSVVFQGITRGAFKKCEIGYKLDRAVRGYGFATEACEAGISHIMKSEKLHRISAIIDVDNESSIKLIERLSFAREGTLKSYVFINGSWRDCFIYSLVDPAVSIYQE